MYKQEYLDYYDQLIEPYCSQAKESIDNFEINPESLHDAIRLGFRWRGTDIGFKQWEIIYQSLERGEETFIKQKRVEKNYRSFFLGCVVDLMGDECITKEEINRRVQVLIDKLC